MAKTNNVIFYVKGWTERGTEIAIYDYANYNEEILGNKSFIVHMPLKNEDNKDVYDKFKSRFEAQEIKDIRDISSVIRYNKINFFHTLTHGNEEKDFYRFNNKEIWQNCKTIKHCVFNTNCPEGDFHISISEYLNDKYHTKIPVIPHIVATEPVSNENLRNEYRIPQNAIVIGRYGGYYEFNLEFGVSAVISYLNSEHADHNVYFLFMNTNVFAVHKNIIYCNKSIDCGFKAKFVNTCDAMIHARADGETFGLAVAEFSVRNKPVITSLTGDLEHVRILGDKAIIYTNKESLISIFTNIRNIISSRCDWNAYSYYTPKNIMNLFNEYIFNKFKSIL